MRLSLHTIYLFVGQIYCLKNEQNHLCWVYVIFASIEGLIVPWV